MNETKKQVPESSFANFRTFLRCRGLNRRGVSLSLPKDTSCCEIQKLKNEKFDSNWCVVQYRKQSILVVTAYIPPGDVNELEEFIKTFGSAFNFAKENIMKGDLFVGDLNARSILWGDSRTNKNGGTLEHYIENKLVKILNNGENTFYSVNGSSVVDLYLTTDQPTNWKSTFYTDNDAELLTGYPSRGHVPVYAKFVLPSSYSTESVTKFKLDDVNWKKWPNSSEDKLRDMSFPDNPIFKDRIAAWNYLKEAINDVYRECIPTKSITKHNKPFWNDQLTQLINEVRSLGKTYKRTSTPQNHEALLKARARFKEELSTAASKWSLRKLEEVNQAKHENAFWKNFKRVFPTN